MTVIDDINRKLKSNLNPEYIKVNDTSGPHYGHDGASPGTISHIGIRVIADIFAGKSRVDRSRMVYDIIKDEIRQVHAITELTTRTPTEEQERAASKNT